MNHRKRYSRLQILGFWEASSGRCWRCGERIEGNVEIGRQLEYQRAENRTLRASKSGD